MTTEAIHRSVRSGEPTSVSISPRCCSYEGKNDKIFPAEGAHPYKRDLKNLELHLLDTGHFALEEDGAVITKLIWSFLEKMRGRELDTRIPWVPPSCPAL